MRRHEDLGGRPHRERRRLHGSRRRARRGEGDLLREEIIEAAERLLSQTGDESAVSIRAVANAVGVTPPSIYMHFADKNALLFEICEKHFARFDSFVEQAAAGATDPLDELRLRGRAYIEFGLSHPEPYRIMFMRRPSATPPEFQNEGLRRSTAFDHHLEAVRRAAGAGLIGGDPLLAAISLWVAVHGLTSLLLSKPDFPWPDREVLLDHVLRASIYGVADKG